MVKLGLNIDHVATVREARRDVVPSVLEAALDGIKGGASGITVHLREDRRHIQDSDVLILKRKIKVPLNLEMSAAEEIVKFAVKTKPRKACLVPEKRKELTTEGGLDVVGSLRQIGSAVSRLQKAGICVSLFIDPDLRQIEAARKINADYIELHTGCYARFLGKKKLEELRRLERAAYFAHELGIGVNAGHGLNYENVIPVAKILFMEELNIGHAIIARSIFTGIRKATAEMVSLIRKAK